MSGPFTIVVTTGGTGGHMFPADALSAELLSRGHRVVFCTDSRGKRYGETLPSLETHEISAGGLAGRGPVGRLKGAVNLGIGVLQARKLLKQLQPDACVGFGGYASAPTMTAAVHLKLKTALHEQNAYLGRANRMLASQVDRICTSVPDTQGIPRQDRVRVTGMPVRDAVKAVRDIAYDAPTLDGPFRILVMGGSQGATVFSDILPDAVAQLPAQLKARLEITQQCRPVDLDRTEAAYAAQGINATLKTFLEDVPNRLAAAHLVITRSGASTCAELTVAGRPAILVPYPHAADDHQTLNARAQDAAGAAWLMPQETFTATAVSEQLMSLMTAPDPLSDAADAAKQQGRPNATSDLADVVIELAGGSNGQQSSEHVTRGAA